MNTNRHDRAPGTVYRAIHRIINVRAARSILLLIVGIGLLAVLVAISRPSSRDILARIRPAPLIGSLFVTAILGGLTSGRWFLLVGAFCKGVWGRWTDYFHFFIVNRLAGLFIPKDVSDILGRTVILNRIESLSLSAAGASVIMDRLWDLSFVVLYGLCIAPYWLGIMDGTATAALMAGAVMLYGTAVGFGHGMLGRLILWSIRASEKAMRVIPGLSAFHLEPLKESYSYFTRRILMGAFCLSFCKYGFLTLRMWLFARAFDIPVPFSVILFGMPLGQIVHMVAFTPGAIGIFELGWFGILLMGGVSGTDAGLFVVGQRVVLMLNIAIIAGMSQLLYSVRMRARAGAAKE